MGEGIARYRRFTGWNYAKGASLFTLSHLGEIVAESLDAMPRLNGGISLYAAQQTVPAKARSLQGSTL